MNTPKLAEPPLKEPPEFSLVLGGLLYQLYCRTRLVGPSLDFVRRRIIVITSIAWLPLLLLSAIDGHLMGVGDSFLHDIETHVRFLIALPILIAAELVVHARIRPAVKQFVDRGIVIPDEVPIFNAAIESAMRLRNSVAIEVGLIILVYTIGLWVWREQAVLNTTTWYAVGGDTGLRLTLPGYWYAFVSIPIGQFILLRWYFRFLIWCRFLWQVSRLNLSLSPAHPDRAGGLGFLGNCADAFAPILFAQGALLAGMIASRIFYGGQNLLDFQLDVVGLVIVLVLFILVPLTMFTPRLAQAKRRSKGEYGRLANRYVQEFDAKWIRGGAPAGEALLGSADIQSLADLGNSYAVVREMRPVPFGLDTVTRLVIVTVAPLLPLVLTIIPLEELVGRLIKAML
jgi:hypothetical protein